jgi:hypothetical protein
VVVEREVFDATAKVLYRGLVKGGNGEHISDTVEGFTSLSNRVLYPIEGIWEGELTPGSPGRVMEYNNRAYQAPKKGEAKVPTRTAGKGGRKPAAKKTSARSERASEAQLDKDAARVVKMRDNQGKSWGDIEATTGIAPSRLRQLYTRGGGSSTGSRAAAKPAARGRGAAAKKPAAKKAAKGRTRGKRSPS